MTVVVDASVALKWVIEEDGSQAAGVLLLEQPLAAPDLLIVECANVLSAKAWRGVLGRDLVGAGEDRGSAVPALAADSSIPRCLPSRSEPCGDAARQQKVIA